MTTYNQEYRNESGPKAELNSTIVQFYEQCCNISQNLNKHRTKDLTGKTIILGMEKNNASIGEIEGVVSSNEVLFSINYDVYFGFGIKESDKIIFDYWDKDSRETMIDKSTLDFKAVAHPTEA